jgi:hypothetical protein
MESLSLSTHSPGRLLTSGAPDAPGAGDHPLELLFAPDLDVSSSPTSPVSPMRCRRSIRRAGEDQAQQQGPGVGEDLARPLAPGLCIFGEGAVDLDPVWCLGEELPRLIQEWQRLRGHLSQLAESLRQVVPEGEVSDPFMTPVSPRTMKTSGVMKGCPPTPTLPLRGGGEKGACGAFHGKDTGEGRPRRAGDALRGPPVDVLMPSAAKRCERPASAFVQPPGWPV